MRPLSLPPTVVVSETPAALALEAAGRFARAAEEAIAERGEFSVALAGGNTPGELYRILADPGRSGELSWDRFHIFFGDERCLPPNHPDSNYAMARAALLDRVPLAPEQIHRMQGEIDPREAAVEYSTVMRRHFKLRSLARPRFDLVLLGLGSDGHTASLFPGMPALAEKRRLVVPSAVPAYVRPPISRLTLTLPVLNAAREVMFLVTGAGKAAAVEQALDQLDLLRPGPGQQWLPAAHVRPAQGQLTWLLDRAAASHLSGRG